MGANERQVGGDHYKEAGRTGEEHWDRVWRLGMNYWQAAATKYIERYKYKNGKQDLEKAIHYIEKLIELEFPDIYKNFVDEWDNTYGKLVIMPCPPHDFAPGQVSPTGWTQFVFEGAHQAGFLYTCRKCKAKFNAPPDENPHATHTKCEELDVATEDSEPTAAYVNQ